MFKGILSSMRLTEEEDFDDNEMIEEAPTRIPRKRKPEESSELRHETVSRTTNSTTRRIESSSIEEEDDTIDFKREKSQRSERNYSNIVPIRGRNTTTASSSMEVTIIKPKSFNDSQDVCDMLLQGQTVVVNLEKTENSLSQRIMDFIFGSVYSVNGKVHQVSDAVFVISPESVDVSGDYEFTDQSSFEVPSFK